MRKYTSYYFVSSPMIPMCHFLRTPLLSQCRAIILLIALSVFTFSGQVHATATSITLPLTLDMELLRGLVAQQLYPLPGDRAQIYGQAKGCNQIQLSSPEFRFDQGYLRFQTKVQIKWGTPIMESCVTPFTWQGWVVLWQKPVVNKQWQLSFETVNSTVLDRYRRPMKTVDILWGLIKDHVHAHLNKILIDLMPPVENMQNGLLPMFDADHQQMALAFFASMQPAPPKITTHGVILNIHAEIDPPPSSKVPPPPFPGGSAYAKVLALWNNWDNFLIFQLKQFSDVELKDEDRQTLLDTMLSARYEFADAIEHATLSNQFIRNQFLTGWQRLAPIFRHNIHARQKTNLLGYLAFFTAGDALHILDQLGPSTGIEISEEGFRRLAAMLSEEQLDLNQEAIHADPALRKVLGLDPLPAEEESTPIPSSQDVEAHDPTSLLLQAPFTWLCQLFTPPVAHAAVTKKASSSINEWTAELTPRSILLPKVSAVLQNAAAQYKKQANRVPQDNEWFDKMIIASAWQESCFRQFHIQHKTITYLLSYNNTSVGIMQVNEKVWRGVYSVQKLRWDIEYNSRAGCEIMALYLRDYLKRYKAPMTLTTPKGQRFLAGWLYSLYNGGPGQRKAFIKRFKTGRLYRAEKLFLNKYDKVQASKWTNKVRCLP